MVVHVSPLIWLFGSDALFVVLVLGESARLLCDTPRATSAATRTSTSGSRPLV